MAVTNPAPRRRIRQGTPVPSPPPRARATVDRHDLFEEYEGPPQLAPVRDPVTQQLTQPQRTLTERLAIISRSDRDEAELLTLQTLHQFVLARTPSDVICQRMNMSTRALRDWRRKLAIKLKEDAKTKDPHDFLGPMLAEMEEVKATAWREAAAAPAKDWPRRMRAMDMIMRANAEISRLLQVAGMFDNQPMRQPLTASTVDDGGASVLKSMAENFLTGGYAANQDYHRSLRPGDTIVDNA